MGCYSIFRGWKLLFTQFSFHSREWEEVTRCKASTIDKMDDQLHWSSFKEGEHQHGRVVQCNAVEQQDSFSTQFLVVSPGFPGRLLVGKVQHAIVQSLWFGFLEQPWPGAYWLRRRLPPFSSQDFLTSSPTMVRSL